MSACCLLMFRNNGEEVTAERDRAVWKRHRNERRDARSNGCYLSSQLLIMHNPLFRIAKHRKGSTSWCGVGAIVKAHSKVGVGQSRQIRYRQVRLLERPFKRLPRIILVHTCRHQVTSFKFKRIAENESASFITSDLSVICL